MMQCCNLCPEWAQWRVRKAQYDSDGKINGWELIAMLCGKDKKEQEELSGNEKLIFDFVGSAPCR